MKQLAHLSLCELSSCLQEAEYSHLMALMGCSGAERISIGSSFCELQLLAIGPEELSFLRQLAQRDGTRFSLTIPAPRQGLLQAVQDKIAEILAALPTCDELVMNDAFLLDRMLAQRPVPRIVSGRLLCAYEHDPRMDNAQERHRELLRVARDLLAQGVDAVEADALEPWLAAEEPLLTQDKLRCHFPAVMLSSTRHCQYAVTSDGRREFLHACAGCRRQCQHVWTAYRGRLLKFGRGIYTLLPPDAPPVPARGMIYSPMLEYRELHT